MESDAANIELNDRQRLLLASAADHLGIPWPDVFEQAIASLSTSISEARQSNGKSETPYQILNRLGLIGCIQGTPPDLSTNRKHMEGYGKHG